jgi:hypothetical protein
MKSKALNIAIFFIFSSISGLQSQNVLKIPNFFDETLKGNLNYVIDLPFKSKCKKTKMQRSGSQAFQVYHLEDKKSKTKLSLCISDNNINYQSYWIQEAGWVLQKCNKKVVILKRCADEIDKEGDCVVYILKEIHFNNLTFCLTLEVVGNSSVFDTTIDQLITSFDESTISK